MRDAEIEKSRKIAAKALLDAAFPREAASRLADEQKAYIEALRGNGYAVAVCKGCDEAFEAITAYLAE